MTYTTKSDMIDRFGQEELEQLTDRDGSANGIVDAVLDAAIDAAEAEVNSYLVGRYSLPLDPVPAQLGVWAADIARYHLHTFSVPETVQTRYQTASRNLVAVSRGTMSLGDETAEDSTESTGHAVVIEGTDRIFSRKSLKSF